MSFAGPAEAPSSSGRPAPPPIPLAEVLEDVAPPSAKPAPPGVPLGQDREEIEKRRSLVGPLAFDAKPPPKSLPKKVPPVRLQERSKLHDEVELKKDLLSSGKVSDTEEIKRLRAEIESLSVRMEGDDESLGEDAAEVPPMRAPEKKQVKAPPSVLTNPPVAPPVSTVVADFLGPDFGVAGPPEVPPEEDLDAEREALAEAPPQGEPEPSEQKRLPRGTFSLHERMNQKGSSGNTLEVGCALVASTSSSSSRETLPYSKDYSS